jgi:glutamyl-tRNA synthetase
MHVSSGVVGLKLRYDGRWRPENARRHRPPECNWSRFAILMMAMDLDDLVKGRISISNHELDDLVIMRGTASPPTI